MSRTKYRLKDCKLVGDRKRPEFKNSWTETSLQKSVGGQEEV